MTTGVESTGYYLVTNSYHKVAFVSLTVVKLKYLFNRIFYALPYKKYACVDSRPLSALYRNFWFILIVNGQSYIVNEICDL
jgi:hypothetical protein